MHNFDALFEGGFIEKFWLVCQPGFQSELWWQAVVVFGPFRDDEQESDEFGVLHVADFVKFVELDVAG